MSGFNEPKKGAVDNETMEILRRLTGNFAGLSPTEIAAREIKNLSGGAEDNATKEEIAALRRLHARAAAGLSPVAIVEDAERQPTSDTIMDDVRDLRQMVNDQGVLISIIMRRLSGDG